MAEQLNKEAFKEKIFDYEEGKDWKFEGALPCVIDFYADWCAPCKMVAPIVEELSKEYEGKLNFYKLNVDEEQEVASLFGIQSIPSILFVPLEEQPQMAMGAIPKDSFRQAIKEVLKVD